MTVSDWDRRPKGTQGCAIRFEMRVARWESGLLGGPLFVGGGAIEAGDGDVVEAQVDAELGDVVDHVVEEHGAEGESTRAVEDDLFAPGELPVGGEAVVGGGDE